jgi:hypothetical protein
MKLLHSLRPAHRLAFVVVLLGTVLLTEITVTADLIAATENGRTLANAYLHSSASSPLNRVLIYGRLSCITCHNIIPGKISDLGKEWAHATCRGCHHDTARAPIQCTGCHGTAAAVGKNGGAEAAP